MAGLAAHEDPAHRTAVADAHCETSARGFRRRQVGQVGPVTFARVHDEDACGTCGFEQTARRRDRAPKLRNVVAQCGAEPAGFEKVTLHIDDEQRSPTRFEVERIGLRFDTSDASLLKERQPPRRGDCHKNSMRIAAPVWPNGTQSQIPALRFESSARTAACACFGQQTNGYGVPAIAVVLAAAGIDVKTVGQSDPLRVGLVQRFRAARNARRRHSNRSRPYAGRTNLARYPRG